ncbi:iron chaperone [Chitinophaga sp. 22321]|uniref:DUF1801 domain-containing protein n=1 Tax=Chitinophaga hostae TaxID=2831022 RepID=A0ABS5J9D5_9BACT|nr:DUF1801 domain-containing protein [Chitinophaga hostae]MBS0031838.1 DUF1801 domain-containing protein [Chitinophaga hostae]
MATDKMKFNTVDEYMATLPEEAGAVLEKVRQIILETAPGAEEVISYQLPALRFHGMLIYYSAYKEHYSLSFPSGTLFKDLAKDLEGYELGKSTVKFLLNKPIPKKLIQAIVKHRMAENLEREITAKKKK